MKRCYIAQAEDKIGELLAWAAGYRLDHAVVTGDVIAESPIGCGANIVATADFEGR